MFARMSKIMVLKCVRVSHMTAIRATKRSAQARWLKVNATESRGDTRKNISRRDKPEKKNIIPVMATKLSAVLRLGSFRTRTNGITKSATGATRVLGVERLIG